MRKSKGDWWKSASKKLRFMDSVTIFSFFSGIGFLDLGFEKAGYRIGYVNELHRPFLDGYMYARNQMGLSEPTYCYHCGSIEDCLLGAERKNLKRHIKAEKTRGGLLGFIGGPPCPDFSIGGKNQGKKGENGILTQRYFDLIKQELPDFFIFENVKGLVSTKKHRLFYEELKKNLISESGYVLSEKLINALEYGVPQDRERIILFGCKRELKLLENHDISDGYIDSFPWDKYVQHSMKELLKIQWPTAEPFTLEERQCPQGVPSHLTVQYWFEKNRVLQHPNANHCFKPRAAAERFRVIYEGDDGKKSFKRLHRWRYSPTACYGNNEVHLHPYQARRISVAEALSIQSLPAEYALPDNMTLTAMFKSVGNGVPFLAAKGIAQTLQYFLNSED